MNRTGLSGVLGEFVAQTASRDLPEDILDRAACCLRHNLMMALAGLPHERIVQPLAARLWAVPAEAPLLSTGTLVSAEGAAFANAALMNVRSQDDNHEASVSHPGVPVLAAALAVAQTRRPSGIDFMAAIVLGYEVLCRIGRFCGTELSRRGVRAASALGVFGAAAASARLIGLDAERSAHALGLATQMAAGHTQLWREGGSEFTTQLGMAARNGIIAARLAEAGVTAVAHSFEGPSGFYKALAGVDVEPDQIVNSLGRDWELREVTIKLHPVCAVLQGPMELLAGMIAEHGLTIGDLREATLHLAPFEADFPGIDNGTDIKTATAAKMSAQFCIALMLKDGRIAFEALARVEDPAVREALPRIELRRDTSLKPRQCRLELGLRNGQTLAGSIDAPVGEPATVREDRYLSMIEAESGVPKARLSMLGESVDGLAAAPGIDGLLAAFPIQPSTLAALRA